MRDRQSQTYTIMLAEIQNLQPWLMLAVIIAVLAIFTIAEMLRKYVKARIEVTRKFVHVSAGMITLTFPYLFTSHLSVLILSLGFLALLVFSRRYHFLESVNAIRRKSFGSLAYPVIIYICFLVYLQTGNPLSYYLPLLIFIISDPLAAFFGMRTKWIPYRIGKDSKTVAGSLAFLISSFLLSACLLVSRQEYAIPNAVSYSLFLAAGATITEAASPWGLDNLLVPLSTLAILHLLNIG
jgi:phytol kinase